MAVHIYKINIFDEAFFLSNYQNTYDHQTFQSGYMLWGALNHKYAWDQNGVVLWGHVANTRYISSCIRYMDTKLDKVLT